MNNDSDGSVLISIVDGKHELWVRHSPLEAWVYVGSFNDMKMFASSQRGAFDTTPPTALLRGVRHA
jgi:hypothetical protein